MNIKEMIEYLEIKKCHMFIADDDIDKIDEIIRLLEKYKTDKDDILDEYIDGFLSQRPKKMMKEKELKERIEKESFSIFELRVLRDRATITVSYTVNPLLKKGYELLAKVLQSIIELQEKEDKR